MGDLNFNSFGARRLFQSVNDHRLISGVWFNGLRFELQERGI